MTALRWIARITGLMIVGLVLLFLIGVGIDLTKLTGAEMAMAASLLTALAGMCILWKWEGVGALLVLAGLIAFYGLNYATAGVLPSGWVFPLCFLPGILSLVSWSWQKQNSVSSH